MHDDDCLKPSCSNDPLGHYNQFHKKSKLSFDQQPEETADNSRLDCPPSRENLGFFTWNLLHSISMEFPDNPTELEKQNMSSFINILSLVYPCKVCKTHFQQ